MIKRVSFGFRITCLRTGCATFFFFEQIISSFQNQLLYLENGNVWIKLDNLCIHRMLTGSLFQ